MVFNTNLGKAVAAYITLMAATFATGTEESHQRRHEVVAHFVNSVVGPMGEAVGSIYRGDCAFYYSGFYLLKPSSSDMCRLAKESYAEAGNALSEVTLLPGKFFRVLGENIESLVEALASVSKEVVKPAVSIYPFLGLTGKRGINPRMN